VGFKCMGAGDGVFHGPFYAAVSVFGVGDVGSMLGKGRVTAARREDGFFMA
jgi:hypothetical protein